MIERVFACQAVGRWGKKAATMNKKILKGVCLVTVGALLASASIGTARAQFYVPSLPFSGGGNTAEHIVTAAVIAITIYSIAHYEATEHQRQIAEARARQSYAHMSGKRRADMKARKVRYIAVDTERGQKTSPKAKKTVMIYDTQTNRVASNTAYDVEKAPSVGQTAKIDNYSAEYVGSGL
ncbi:MAG TPA: hypothetical protein VLO30_09175 [Chthoniobacterales bacterium]|nr:hypothetical protein [Chthoniobacterales bacterium]